MTASYAKRRQKKAVQMSTADWIGIVGFALALGLAIIEFRRHRRPLRIFINRIQERSDPTHGVVLVVHAAVVNNSTSPKIAPVLYIETDSPITESELIDTANAMHVEIVESH